MTSNSNGTEDDDLKDLKAKMNAAKAKQKDMDKDDDDEEEGKDRDEFLDTWKRIFASGSLRQAYASYPQWVNNPELESGKGKQPWADKSVSVPAGFEGVNTLGPVMLVCAPKGVHMPHLGTPHASTLVVYQDGFAYQAGSKDVKLWRFDEVAAIQTNEWLPSVATTTHEYTLFRNNGESLILDEGVHLVVAASNQIKFAVFKRLVESFVQRYEAGEALTFGPVTVQQQNGLQLSGNHYGWRDIQNVTVNRGKFKMMLNNNEISVRASEIPNIELLGRLIGLNSFALEEGLAAF